MSENKETSGLFRKEKPKEQKKLKIGEYLISKNVVDPEVVTEALNIQSKTGSRIGEILQAQGNISAYKFYIELADFLEVEFVNLEEVNLNDDLLLEKDKDNYYISQYIPFDSNTENVIKIATTNPSPELKEFLASKYGDYELFITSPFDILWSLQKRFTDFDTKMSCEELFEATPEHSSKTLVASPQITVIFILSLILVFMLLQQNLILVTFIAFINLFYFSTIISKLLFFFTGQIKQKKMGSIVTDEEVSQLDDNTLPVYSIIVPLYKEKKITINNLITALKRLDYPKEKLDIKFAIETKDFETLETIKSLKPPSNFQIIRVPNSHPKTKPKACNYALRYCKGEYVTIYDAEDIPDADQLKKVIALYNRSEKNLGCVQARLNYYNRKENLLTKLFSLEYSSWFDFMLYGLKYFKLPLPLGGTSNHFKTQILKSLYAWDPYNVTEDADLGIRLSLTGLKAKVLNSYTMEESPITVKAWYNQRVRWVKGYIQTYFVHMRNPQKVVDLIGIKGLLGFFFFVGAPFFVFSTVPIVTLLSIIMLYSSVEAPDWLMVFLTANFIFGMLAHWIIALIVTASNRWDKMLLASITFPFYWVLHYFSSYGALIQLFKDPHHWNKTEHGNSKYLPTESN